MDPPAEERGSRDSSASFLGHLDESRTSANNIDDIVRGSVGQAAQPQESAENAVDPQSNRPSNHLMDVALEIMNEQCDWGSMFNSPARDEPPRAEDCPVQHAQDKEPAIPLGTTNPHDDPLVDGPGEAPSISHTPETATRDPSTSGQLTPSASPGGPREHRGHVAPENHPDPQGEGNDGQRSDNNAGSRHGGSGRGGGNPETVGGNPSDLRSNPSSNDRNQGLSAGITGSGYADPGSRESNPGPVQKKPKSARKRLKLTPQARARLSQLNQATSVSRPSPVNNVGGRNRKSPDSSMAPPRADPVNAHSRHAQERLSDFEGEDDEEAQRFEQIELEYLQKREAKTDTEADRLLYLNAKRKEERRLASMRDGNPKRARPDATREQQPRAGSETLFVSDNDEEDSSEETYDMTPAAKKARKRSQKQAERSRVNRGLAIGLEAQREKAEKKKRKRKSQPQKEKPQKGKRKNESKKDGPERRSKRRKQAVNEAVNSGNFFSSRDVGADANQNLGQDVARFTDKKKKQAFAELVASTPLDNRNTTVMDKRNLYHAMAILGRNRCRLNEDGVGFSLTGTTLSLRPYQVLGAAFMKERERGPDGPIGGICADELGLGKTVQTLACMASNPPDRDSIRRTDLIVASPALLTQWEEEIQQHLKKKLIMIRHQGNSKVRGPWPELVLERCDIVLTSYEELRESFPKFSPPPEIVDLELQYQWYRETFRDRSGPLHKVSWRRVICDEAHVMKNRESQTFKAMKAIDASIRWAVTGTPSTNFPEEIFPYFSWLQVAHSGTFDTFRKNFIEAKGGIANARLRAFLKNILMRRTHQDTLLGRPLLRLPEFRSFIVHVDFDETERYLYEMIRKRYAEKINQFHKEGVLEKRKRNVLTYLLRLRQACCHFFLCEQDIRELVEGEDIEVLWTKMEKPSNMLLNMRKAFAQKREFKTGEQVVEPEQPADNNADETHMTLEFRKVLRDLAKPEMKNAILLRTLCGRCSEPPADPWFTDCCHIYCHECLEALMMEAVADGEEAAKCLACGTQYKETKPCEGIKEFSELADSRESSPTQRRRTKGPKEESDVGWMSIGGNVIPSAKLAGFAYQVRKWMTEEKGVKVLVFCQWERFIHILSRYCDEQGWG